MKEHYSVSVYNTPMFPRRYVACRLVKGKLWYWGSWDDEEMAEEAAKQFDNGMVVVCECEEE